MTSKTNDSSKWESFLKWILGLALSALIALHGVLYSQIMAKMDRMTNLMLSERDRVLNVLDKVCGKLTDHEVLLYRHHEVIENLKEKQKADEQKKTKP